MKLFIHISIIKLILLGCSYSDKKTDKQKMYSTSENFYLFLEGEYHFYIYTKKDTMSFFLDANDYKSNEYIYDIYNVKDSIKSGRLIYGINFSDSNTLSLFFDCKDFYFPPQKCNRWLYFVKSSQSNLYYEKCLNQKDNQ